MSLLNLLHCHHGYVPVRGEGEEEKSEKFFSFFFKLFFLRTVNSWIRFCYLQSWGFLGMGYCTFHRGCRINVILT